MRTYAGVICICLCALAALAAIGGASRAMAQEAGGLPQAAPNIVVAQNEGIRGFFQRLLRPREPQQPDGIRRIFPRVDQQAPQQQQPRQRVRRSPAPTPRAIATVEKAEGAKRVLVVGDFMASGLAKGLSAAYSDNPNALVIDATSGSSGLVRNDYYDWPAKLPSLVEEQNPDAVLVLLGGNDRQTMNTDTGPYVLGSDGWRAAYAARVNALIDALKATGKPFLWVGLAPVQSSSMSRDYSTFNGIVREQLEAKGLPFIDIWNGFADAEGKYVAVGPDVRGQSVQLRASDGLNFTKAGQRKIAYFVEQELQDIFGGIAPQLATTGLGTGEAGPQIGPMVPLDALAATGGDALLTGHEAKEEGGSAVAAIERRLSGEDAPPVGRADSYSWPPPEPKPEPAEPVPTAR